MSGRHAEVARRQRSRGRWWIAVVVAAVLFAGVGVVGYVAVASDPTRSCATVDEVAVAVDPTIEGAVRTAVADGSDVDHDCVRFTVTAQRPADTATSIATPGSEHADLWVPDSSTWLLRTLRSTGSLPELATPSVASTVPVVLARTDRPLAPSSWLDVLRTPGLRLGDPLTESPATAAVMSALAESELSMADPSVLSEALVPMAQAFGLTAGAASSVPQLIDAVVADGGTAVVTEQASTQYLTTNPVAALTRSVPTTGAYFLDYPLAVTADAGPRSTLAARAGRTLATLLGGEKARMSLADAGFRPATGVTPADGGVGSVTPLSVQDPTGLEALLKVWAVLALPLRTLVLQDVSGSMNMPFENSTRMGLTVEASLSANDIFNDRTQMGMWAFSTERGPNGQDYQELVPLQSATAQFAGKPQRQALLDAVRGLPSIVGGNTGLYDTTLAAFRRVKEGYDPNYVNSIIVLTDGANEDPGSIDLDQLVATLQQEQDPVRPVVIVTVGITADADQASLARISAATGGTSWVARSPRDIPGIFLEALNARKARIG